MSRGIVRFLEALPTGFERGQQMAAQALKTEDDRISHARNQDMRASEQELSALFQEGPGQYDAGTFKRPEHTQAGALPPPSSTPMALGGGRENFQRSPEQAAAIAGGASKARQGTDFRSWEKKVMAAAAKSGNLEHMAQATAWAQTQRQGMLMESMAGASRLAAMGDMEGVADVLNGAGDFLPGLEGDLKIKVKDGKLVMPSGETFDAMDTQMFVANLLRMGDPMAMQEFIIDQMRADTAEGFRERELGQGDARIAQGDRELDMRAEELAHRMGMDVATFNQRADFFDAEMGFSREQFDEGNARYDEMFKYETDRIKAQTLNYLNQAQQARFNSENGFGGLKPAEARARWNDLNKLVMEERVDEIGETGIDGQPDPRLAFYQNPEMRGRIASTAQRVMMANPNDVPYRQLVEASEQIVMHAFGQGEFPAFSRPILDEEGNPRMGPNGEPMTVEMMSVEGTDIILPQGIVNFVAQNQPAAPEESPLGGMGGGRSAIPVSGQFTADSTPEEIAGVRAERSAIRGQERADRSVRGLEQEVQQMRSRIAEALERSNGVDTPTIQTLRRNLERTQAQLEEARGSVIGPRANTSPRPALQGIPVN